MGSQKQVQLLEKGEENLLKEQQELGEKIEKAWKNLPHILFQEEEELQQRGWWRLPGSLTC